MAEPAGTGSGDARSVLLQARVKAAFARKLLEEDAPILGLRGQAEVVRAALQLLHREALGRALAASYDEFYGDKTAPLPSGVAPIDDHD